MIFSLLRASAAALLLASSPARADDPAALAQALEASARKDWASAEAQGRASGPLGFDIIEWQRLRAGEGQAADYADFIARRGDWPGMALLRKKGEAKLADAPAAQVLSYFEGQAPQTGAGVQALVAAHRAMGDGSRASAALVAAWRSLELDANAEAALLTAYPEELAEHHGGRIAALLDAGELSAAERMLPRVSEGTRAVALARVALQRRSAMADAAVAAVPERMVGSAGLARDRASFRAAKDNPEGAAELILAASQSVESLGEPALWAKLRARLARAALREGAQSRAYRLAANHHLPESADAYADLEWIAGYAALKLGDAPTALKHFEHLRAVVQSPISTARAGYWQGRALEDMGRAGEARAAYALAATQQTAFYGLLAAEKLGQPLDPALAGTAPLPDWRGAAFTQSSVYQAAALLHDAGEADLARRFMLHLSESQPAAEIGLMSALALEWRDATLAVKLAKRAADGGTLVMAAYYPVVDLSQAQIYAPPELVLAITRRESEFDADIGSPAGALGLMQVMPETGRLMAKRLGQIHEPARLTEPLYNLSMGSAYLAKLLEDFGSSPLLVAAGYNAGPGRPKRWIEERGDPRVSSTDLVDWVEMIPFDETRNYVMRVSESLPIYRMRLGLEKLPSFTNELRGR